MRSIVNFASEDVFIDRASILSSQGIPEDAELSENFERIYGEAEELFRELAEPAGILCGVSTSQFEDVFRGEGLNEPSNPVEDIYRKSSFLALFAVTLGAVLSESVSELFDNGNYASGYMLDSVSSFASDKLTELAAAYLESVLAAEEPVPSSMRILSYSPGYCGWNISGQKRLFEVLRPQEIGITLNESYLMSPIKTVSGVLIAGSGEIHKFVNSYPFCDACTTKSCVGRMRKL
ncbi:MAG: vitamin B12 dependent-methionine synthase activation domain-containing protein [Candidatus Fermentibacteria bacterium]